MNSQSRSVAVKGDLPIRFQKDAPNRLRFVAGDSLLLPGEGSGDRLLYQVVKRTLTGYILRHEPTQSQREWPDDEIFGHYVHGTLSHYRANLLGISEQVFMALETDLSTWDPKSQFKARCRETYCRRVDELIDAGAKLPDALAEATESVFLNHHAEWEVNAAELEQQFASETEKRRRKAIPIMKETSRPQIAKPSFWAMRQWYGSWRAGGRDVRALLPRYDLRGNRQSRLQNLVHLQTDPNTPLCAFGAMQIICTDFYMKMPRIPVAAAFRRLKKLCEQHSISLPSHTAFRKYIRDRYSAYDEYKARHGTKAAWLKFNLFDRRTLPTIPLQEVEIDHTLIDTVVLDRKGKRHRPWLTLLIDRATRAILGFHIGFDWPSFATVQRALVHAICVKDLRGITGLKNGWPCHGVPQFIITDRGLEFLSLSFSNACADLGINVINLKGRCPHLKGAIERMFGTMNVQVFDCMDGSVKSRADQVYDPHEKARYTLADLTHRIVQWIVDEYHVEEHPSLGTTPILKWNELVALHGVTPVNDFNRMLILMGETVHRKISNIGVQFDGHVYKSDELEALRRRRDGLERDWTIRIDPYDRGHIWVHDEENRKWLVVPAVHQRSAKGISKFQARMHLAMARKITPNGKQIDDATMLEAIKLCDEEASQSPSKRAARYDADGALSTPVYGNTDHVPTILGITEKPSTPEVSADATPDVIGSPVERLPTASGYNAQIADLLAQRLAATRTNNLVETMQ
jgi:putative transposase